MSRCRRKNNGAIIPLHLRKKCCVLPQGKMTLHVGSDQCPQVTTPAVVESRIVTEQDVQTVDTPQALNRLMIVERTTRTWSAANSTAMIEVADPSSRHVRIEHNTLYG